MKNWSKIRYQDCPTYIQVWRERYYLLIPFQMFWYTYIKPIKIFEDEIVDGKIVHTDNYSIMKGKNLKSLLVGKAQGKMNFFWTFEEVKERLKIKE